MEIEKVIIAVVGPPNTGKSSAIMQLVKRFSLLGGFHQEHPKEPEEPKNDAVGWGLFISERTSNQVKLGICSTGDSKSILEEYLKPLIDEQHCDIIVVACHNYQERESNTLYYITTLAKEDGYRLLSTSIIRDESINRMSITGWADKGNNSIDENVKVLNEIFADNLSHTITTLI